MTDIMLDLETMGVRPDAAIIAIGAVEFDLEEKTLGREFYEVIDLESAMKAGGTVSASTILWWMRQSDEARREFYKKKGIDIAEALYAFHSWAFAIQPEGVWGNGSPFDNVILRSACERLNIPVPWYYAQDRCFRTIKATRPGVELGDPGVEHKAIDDAIWQARYLMEVMG